MAWWCCPQTSVTGCLLEHLAHFILEAVQALELRQAKANGCGTDNPQDSPARRLALLIDSDGLGRLGAGRIELKVLRGAQVTVSVDGMQVPLLRVGS